MNDRIYQALSAAGLSTSPLSILDHASTYASAFFALYDAELLYHEGGKNSQVPLRDVTRIHSDREGVLRVETSERTAVTASLVGYDPGRVQAFFQQVRDVTARAKELPVVPLNQAKTELPGLPKAELPGSSVPAAGMPGLSAYTPATTPAATPAAPAIPAAVAPTAPVAVTPAAETPAAAPVATPAPLAPVSANPASASPATVTATRREPPRPEPVVISSMPPVSDPPAFQERAGERNRQANIQASTQATRTAQRDNDLEAGLLTGAHTQGPLVSVPISRPLDRQPAEADLSNEALGVVSELQRRAEGVQGLARTVSLLAVVLGVAAIALAYFQWQGAGTSTNGTLSAIWTLLAGGVGSVALLAFAEALRLLSALARSAQHRQG